MNIRSSRVFSASIAAAGLLIACGQPDCVSGNFDGTWHYFGNEPPPIDLLRNTLVGTDVHQAETMISSPPLIMEDKKYIWAFEQRKKLMYRNCTNEDVLSYRQDLLIVEATVDNEKITSCIIRRRGTLSQTGWLDQEKIINGEANPLDGDALSCY